ncbi:MAG: hypothetical protein ACREOO_00485 [bacterium]
MTFPVTGQQESCEAPGTLLDASQDPFWMTGQLLSKRTLITRGENFPAKNNSEENTMFNLTTDFFAYLLLSFMLLAIALAFWLRFTWFPTLLSSRPPAKEDNGASKSSPDLLKRR